MIVLGSTKKFGMSAPTDHENVLIYRSVGFRRVGFSEKESFACACFIRLKSVLALTTERGSFSGSGAGESA